MEHSRGAGLRVGLLVLVFGTPPHGIAHTWCCCRVWNGHVVLLASYGSISSTWRLESLLTVAFAPVL